MTQWTPTLVEERLAEAASVLRALPDHRIQGYHSAWPKVLHEFSDLVGQAPRRTRWQPSPEAISRMEETLSWTVGLEPIDGKIVWMKASGARWKIICCVVGLERSAAHQHWLYALCVISFGLNGRRFNRNLSKRKVIELAGAAQR